MKLIINIRLCDDNFSTKKASEISIDAEETNVPIGETVDAMVDSMVNIYMDWLAAEGQAKKQVAEVQPE